MRTTVFIAAFCVLIGSALAAEIFNCRQMGESCRGVPKCCNELICRAEGKWNPFKGGHCGACGKSGERCVKDSQCCKGFQCDKAKFINVNGYCAAFRPAGARCHNNDQCLGDCNKKWYKVYGTCSG